MLNYETLPKCFKITLDRQLTYQKQLENISTKIKTRNNIIQNQTGTTWDASAGTLDLLWRWYIL